MGYRSDVAYRIRFEDEDALREFVALVLAKGEKDLTTALYDCEVADEDTLAFYTTDVKWYESYSDVQAHHALLDFAEEIFGERSGYMFMRIGEDADDVDTRYAGENELIPSEDFYIVRHINLPDSKTISMETWL